MLRQSDLRLVLIGLVLASTLLIRPATIAAEDSSTFTVMPAGGRQTVEIGEEVTFAVIDPDPGKRYAWSFGDGTPSVTGTRVTHAFSMVRDVAVRLSTLSIGAQSVIGTQVVKVTPALRGLFASDIDHQFSPADVIQVVAAVRATGATKVTLRIGGGLIGPASVDFTITGEEEWLQLPNLRLADERNETIREELLKKPGASLPLGGGLVTLALDYTTTSGARSTIEFTPTIRDFFAPEHGLALTYPKLSDRAGLPPEGAGNDGFYLRGNLDFHHPEDWYVRRLALEFGRRGGPWPDEPAEVATNIYKSIDTLLGDADPGDFNNDYNLARLFEDGTLSRTRKNGEYICIAQAYFLSSMARTLGLPAREVNNAIGTPLRQRSDGVWLVSWWQEAGVELWYDEAWHYFDSWLGMTDRQGYLAKNLIYQSWVAYDRQATEYRTVKGEPTGMRGHNFNVWPGDPPHWSFLEEGIRPGIVVDGMIGEPEAAPITRVGGPAAAGIASLPVVAGGSSGPVLSALGEAP